MYYGILMRIILLLFLCCQAFAAAQLQKVEVRQQGGKVSLYFVLTEAVPHKAFTLTNPDRIVVDFENTRLAFNLKSLTLRNHLIKLVRSGSPTPHSLRLVFEVTDPVKFNASSDQRVQKANHAFSLNVFSSRAAALLSPKASNLSNLKSSPRPPAISSSKNQSITEQLQNKVNHPVQAVSMPKGKLRDVVVVIDPGHGGHDPGAMGPYRSQEKQVTLAIARQLKQVIDRQPGMHAVLTRTGDYYVGLRDRLTIARRYNGDIFVSIHADAFNNPASSGASVFALSQRGATSEAARWLAEKENYSELGGVNLKALDDNSGLVRTVLIDLSQTATISASLKMGDRVLKNLHTMTRLHDQRVDQARFMVLKSPDIPSILVETGFISNPREARDLTSPRYQAKLSQAIFQGIKSYFWDYPPQGSRIEALAGNNPYHLVKRGESLSGIANQYRVSIAALSATNHLTHDSVQIGQRLVIPA